MQRPILPIIALAFATTPVAAETLSLDEVILSEASVVEEPAAPALGEPPRERILEPAERIVFESEAVERGIEGFGRMEFPRAEPRNVEERAEWRQQPEERAEPRDIEERGETSPPPAAETPRGVEEILEEVPGGPETPADGEAAGGAVGTGDIAPVPLPASLWVLLAGLGGLALVARKRIIG